jgi:hypothetical protein
MKTRLNFGPRDAVMASVVDPRTMLVGVNDFLEASGQPPAFKIQLVGLTKEVKLHGEYFLCTLMRFCMT